jgi:AraC-like DNA-binding protein
VPEIVHDLSVTPDAQFAIIRDSKTETISRTMPMTANDILAHPALEPCVRSQARSLLQVQETSPRLASLFATQQRWLMAHAGLSQFFRNETIAADTGLLAERFLELVVRHDIASRNTASAFLKEMLKYGIVRYVAGSEGKRHRPFEPAPEVLMALFHWHALHLATLDGLDGGARATRFHARPVLLGAIQPLIADGLIGSSHVREPGRTFSLFTWVDEGGLVMDRLIVGCRPGADGLARIPTDVTSVSALAQRLNLSRTQLGRKFAEAEAMGSMGWTGPRGRSPLWVSAAFRQEYHVAQAVKLAIIDAAFEACTRSEQVDRQPASFAAS